MARHSAILTAGRGSSLASHTINGDLLRMLYSLFMAALQTTKSLAAESNPKYYLIVLQVKSSDRLSSR